MDNFTVLLKDAKQFADCVEPRAAADGWLSSLHFEEDCPKNLHHDGIVVCQVPPSLIFNCELSFIKDEKYKAVLSTFVGNPQAHLEKDLPPSLLMMSHLERHMKEAAEAMGFLQGVIRRSMSLSMAQWKSRRH